MQLLWESVLTREYACATESVRGRLNSPAPLSHSRRTRAHGRTRGQRHNVSARTPTISNTFSLDLLACTTPASHLTPTESPSNALWHPHTHFCLSLSEPRCILTTRPSKKGLRRRTSRAPPYRLTPHTHGDLLHTNTHSPHTKSIEHSSFALPAEIVRRGRGKVEKRTVRFGRPKPSRRALLASCFAFPSTTPPAHIPTHRHTSFDISRQATRRRCHHARPRLCWPCC